MRAVYSPHYDIRFLGLERLHPFDARKYSRAWGLVPRLWERQIPVHKPVTDAALALVHAPEYLQSLRRSQTLAAVLELELIARFPGWLAQAVIVSAMRYAVAGTVLAARAAQKAGLVFNLAGGYHHAKPDNGEGFCLFNDIALAIATLRADGLTGPIAYIDLDAHRGNGVAHCVQNDRRVYLFDMFNALIYPKDDTVGLQRLDWPIPLVPNTPGATYLRTLEEQLPAYLDAVEQKGPIGLAIYNAGTDVLEGDPLGGLGLSADDILARDLFVLEALRARQIPTIVLPSGGYTDESHRLIARTLKAALARFGAESQ